MRRSWILLGAALAAALGCGVLRAQTTLPRGVRIDRLVVDKSEGRMWAYEGGREVGVYHVSVGRGDDGPKRWEGDARTPEGSYRIDRRHRSERFHRFLHVSYPNRADRQRYRRLRAAGEVPLSNGRPVGIGGAIGIHGTGSGLFNRVFGRGVNLTLGCIMVSNDEAEELYARVRHGARIEIRP